MKTIRETFEMLKPYYSNPVENPKDYSMENGETEENYREMQGALRALFITNLISAEEYRSASRYLIQIHYEKQWYS